MYRQAAWNITGNIFTRNHILVHGALTIKILFGLSFDRKGISCS